MLNVRNLYKSYVNGEQRYDVLKDVNFSVEKGEFVAVMGPSGSGKTTLLNCISCFIAYEKGVVCLNNEKLCDLEEDDIARIRNEKLGFVFQDFMLLDGLSLFENVCIPQVIQGAEYRQMEKKAGMLLSMFGINDISDKYPVEVSGGQRQRAAVARAMINDPLLILADEPTGNLDSRSSESVINAFIEAKKSLGATIFMVTHDSFSASYCDRVIVMKDGNISCEIKKDGSRKHFLEKLLGILKEQNGGEAYGNE